MAYSSDRDHRGRDGRGPQRSFQGRPPQQRGGGQRPAAISDDAVFGIRAVMEALEAGKPFDRVLIARGAEVQGNDAKLSMELRQKLKDAGAPVQFVPIEKIESVARGRNHQGILAFVSAVTYQDLNDVLAAVFERGEVPLVLLLDGVTDVRNIGAIARTAECMGAHALLLPSHGSARLGADAMKTSAGALAHLPVCRVESAKHAVAELQAAGLNVIACTEKADDTPEVIDAEAPLCLLLGDEGEGISPAVLKACDQRVRIPMKGKISSLNVGIAAGMLLYEVSRRRKA